MSSELVWNLVRDSNAFIVKRNGVVFSRESSNLTNEHKPRFSGLTSSKNVGITSNGKQVAVSIKAKKARTVNGLNKHPRDSAIAVQKMLKNYRSDLSVVAAARYGQLKKSLSRTVKPVYGGKTRRTFKRV